MKIVATFHLSKIICYDFGCAKRYSFFDQSTVPQRIYLKPLSVKKQKIQSESDFTPARASPSGFAAPYNFSISITCGFAFGHVQERVFMWYILHIRHLEG